MEIAKRGYSVNETVELIYSPQPQNWPDYATPMAPMTHVPEADVKRISRMDQDIEKIKFLISALRIVSIKSLMPIRYNGLLLAEINCTKNGNIYLMPSIID